MDQMDAHISRLDSINTDAPQPALTEVWGAVAAFNADASRQQADGLGLNPPERLQEWLDRLLDKTKAIVERLSDATSFNISVGTPFNVTLGVTFDKRSH